ncbi:uncharacterized protein (DUF58 family) [Pedobacter sp. AK017]|uniref:DUF58 domain-containing protein n=1 Tax=Pedobacter sp. AK017 TaxID=2723073 RepID=UPI0017D2EE43|nr:DUF58 domain-containing protein [Pedobacter sp. AK017]MBB5438469.1 uncharacterized protein (DUF58 family) [Pedobacter sp. AK017]
MKSVHNYYERFFYIYSMQSPIDETTLHFNGNLELLARQVVEGFITGLHKSPFHGFSVEFAEHRLYNVGDNVKNIDWKLYARTDKLFSKRYEEETNLRCQFIIDVSSSMYFPLKAYNKLNFSVQAVAALVYLLKRQRDAFGLSLFTDQLVLNTPAKSTTTHQKYLFARLEEILKAEQMNVKTNLDQALHQIAELIHKRSLVVVFSDLLSTAQDEHQIEGLFSALQHLKFNKHEVIIFNVIDKAKEVDFKFENRPYQFVDMETGAILKAHTSKVKDAYLLKMQAYRQAIQLKCAQYKIDMVDADIAKGFYPILQAYLIKRQKMS